MTLFLLKSISFRTKIPKLASLRISSDVSGYKPYNQ